MLRFWSYLCIQIYKMYINIDVLSGLCKGCNRCVKMGIHIICICMTDLMLFKYVVLHTLFRILNSNFHRGFSLVTNVLKERKQEYYGRKHTVIVARTCLIYKQGTLQSFPGMSSRMEVEFQSVCFRNVHIISHILKQ